MTCLHNDDRHPIGHIINRIVAPQPWSHNQQDCCTANLQSWAPLLLPKVLGGQVSLRMYTCEKVADTQLTTAMEHASAPDHQLLN